MNKFAPPLAVIAGPTASGKSALALALAQRTNGVIVNADSAQVYSDLRILSARPSNEEMAGVEHRLFGHRDGASPCSAASWAAEARAVIAEVHDRGQLPILVGGTGLYLRTLLDGIAEVPEIDLGIRAEVRAASVADNHARLRVVDGVAAERLHPNDSTRIARALEVVLSTGVSLKEWQKAREGGIRKQVRLLGLTLLGPRALLDAAIDRRFFAMVKQGAIEEARRLFARRLSPALPVMRAIGVREVGSYLEGASSFEGMVAAGQLATRQYAKRQVTWFRNQDLGLEPFRDALEGPGFEVALHALLSMAKEGAC
jgi:tRNA dimethylallyltransferase